MANIDLAFLGPSAVGGQVKLVRYFVNGVAGNFAAQTAAPLFSIPVADTNGGRIVSVDISAVAFTTSTDRTAAATLKKISGTTAAAAVCSTDPAFGPTASGTGMKSTQVGGTGITQAVVKTDGTATGIVGDMFTLDTTFAGANGTLGTGFEVVVGYQPFAIFPTS